MRIFWWNVPGDAGGLLDGYYDPTSLYYAALAWQSVVDPPAQPMRVTLKETNQVSWRDHHGRRYLVWWRSSDDMAVRTMGDKLKLPPKAIVADPLHGRLLRMNSSDTTLLCSWPIIARESEVIVED